MSDAQLPAVTSSPRWFQPRSVDEALVLSERLAKSQMVPAQYVGKPENILVAIMMGAELGLSPTQALQNIAVISGRPSLFGDAVLALVKSHPDFEWIKEEQDPATAQATCIVKRRSQPEVTARFSVEDAQRAGLWGKSGPWSTNPRRMLQMRARSFALRDSFPDALRGIGVAEEEQDKTIQATVVVTGHQPLTKTERLRDKIASVGEQAQVDQPTNQNQTEPKE